MKNDPVDPRVRLAIARWPESAPRGSVTAFCAEHGISRKTFYVLRARAREAGQAAVLEPRSRRPRSSPTRVADTVKEQAVEVRATLEASGLDHGPISVFERMRSMGLESPSVASLARIFRERGVARAEPKKRPRASFRRFTYPAPNACWQMDATEYRLADGRKCVIFQLEDDHSRVAVASLVAAEETAEAAMDVMRAGIAARGVPQRLLTDNGVALNPSRRGWTGQLVEFVTGFGIQAITGKPGKPSTQGKNERFHQTLFRWLDKQPHARTMDELQEQIDRFDVIYNTRRPHQALPGRITPQQAWEATPVAEPPRPTPAPIEPVIPAPVTEPLRPEQPWRARTTRIGRPPATDYTRKVGRGGTVRIRGVDYRMGSARIGQIVRAIVDDERTITFFDTTTGEQFLQHPLPTPGTRYIR